jgi:hypothetical protein
MPGGGMSRFRFDSRIIAHFGPIGKNACFGGPRVRELEIWNNYG